MTWDGIKTKIKEELFDFMISTGMLVLGSLFITMAVMIPIWLLKFLTDSICA